MELYTKRKTLKLAGNVTPILQTAAPSNTAVEGDGCVSATVGVPASFLVCSVTHYFYTKHNVFRLPQKI